MAHNAQKSFDVASGATSTYKFNGHPRYDAFRVDVDSGEADVVYYVSAENELDKVDTGSAAEVASASGVTGSDGTEAAARTVLVEITEGTGSANVAGTIYAHNASDPAQNGAAFANR